MVRVPYQKFWTRFTPPCPLTPSCSEYAIQVIREHGWRRGIIMADEYMHTPVEH